MKAQIMAKPNTNSDIHSYVAKQQHFNCYASYAQMLTKPHIKQNLRLYTGTRNCKYGFEVATNN